MSNKFENYRPAPLSCLLPGHDGEEHKISDLELREKAHKLEKALMSFNISAEVVDIKCGPSVTRFEVSLKPGTKITKVTGLEDDIMMALAANSIRIEAPVPGKYSIAVEIPNEHNETVRLRRLVETDDFLTSSPLTVPVGLDVSGRPVYCDLAKMPNLLVAGSTGSGKSSCINAFLTGILLHSSPEDVRLILVDPKIVEYYAYKGIPHLLMPVINESKQAVGALNWAICEMQRRYRIFEESAVRDIKEFNEKYKNDPEFERMPRILIVIDELAELMMVAAGEVETCISRIAALARAAGIHLLIATQRPTADVITGIIKANIGSRIAFAVTSGIDSRSILDHFGAEKLLGRGDMLYAPMYAPRPIRCQGVFTSEAEIESVVDYLKKQYGEFYDASVIAEVNRLSSAESLNTDSNKGEDELFNLAVQAVIEYGAANTQVLQRRLGIGYPRAARLIDELEKRGIIGPFEGSRPRKVLITESEWRNTCRTANSKEGETKVDQCRHGLIADNVINEVLSKTDIGSVVSKYVELNRKGKLLWGLCPFHKEKIPSFSVSPDKGIYKCFGCGKGGNVIHFIMEMENLTYSEAVIFLADLCGVEIPENFNSEYEVEKEAKNRIKEILKEAAEYYYMSFLDSDIGKPARDFLSESGISKQTIHDFGIGYSPADKTALYEMLKGKGYTDEELLKSGIFAMSIETKTLYDLFRGRLVFPVCDQFGSIISFGGRALGDEKPKYINSPDSLVYKKQNNLYAMNLARKEQSEQLIVVEGYMDALAMHSAGLKNTVAVLGTSFTDGQLKLCYRYAEEIVLVFDSDNARQKAMLRIIKMMMEHLKAHNEFNTRIKIAIVPDGMGLKEYIKENGPEKIKDVVRYAFDIDDYLLKRAKEDNTDPITGVLDLWKYQEDICLYASWMNDDIKISRMACVAAPLLGATPESVTSQIRKYIKYNSRR